MLDNGEVFTSLYRLGDEGRQEKELNPSLK